VDSSLVPTFGQTQLHTFVTLADDIVQWSAWRWSRFYSQVKHTQYPMDGADSCVTTRLAAPDTNRTPAWSIPTWHKDYC